MEPWEWEIIRRSTVMLSRGQPALNREQVLELLEELERLQLRERQARELAVRMRTLLDRFDT